MYDTLRALGITAFRVRFSDRNVLNSLLDFAGIPHASSHAVFRVLDKLDKIGLEGISAELSTGRVDASGDKIRGLGLSGSQIDRIKQFLAVPRGTRSEGPLRTEPALKRRPLGGRRPPVSGLHLLVTRCARNPR